MIVDCYTHTWDSPEQLGRSFPNDGRVHRFIGRTLEPAAAGSARHVAAAEPVDCSIVLGFKSHYLGASIPNERIAEHVRAHRDRMVAFAGVDPSGPKEAIAELRRCKSELGMVGLSIAPAAQDFHPSNSQAMTVYAEAAQLALPIVFHAGVHVSAATKLEYAHPLLLDEVAREFPELKIVIAHLGYPWMEETIVLLEKHPNVYAEISWLMHQPWKAHQALLSAYQCHVMDKLLFGSGFPFAPASMGIEALYSINHLCQGTNLPMIPREQLRGIVERDALTLLGVSAAAIAPRSRASRAEAAEEVDVPT